MKRLDISDEARRLCRVTPLLWAAPLACWLKLENLQATGSFKLRGAALKLSRLDPQARVRGVVTASAGNHGAGVALAARRFGIRATIVVPERAVQVKVAAIEREGAEVVFAGDCYEDAQRAALRLSRERGALFVSPFDDDEVIEGNGDWLASELLEERSSLRRVIAPVGGGGLTGGLARSLAPSGVVVLGVEPRVNCSMHDSLREGRPLTDYRGAATICDGLAGAIAPRTFELARAHLGGVALVEEEEVLAAVAFAYRTLGLIVEPSAAVVIAAARAGRVPVDPETVLVLTGGNIDPALLDRALALPVLHT